jgi:quinol monooxygenase YgiN
MSTQAEPPLFLHVAIQVAPKDVPAFLEALKPCWQACVNEPECLFFDVTQDPENPGSFRFVEAWSKGKEWFIKHQITKPYYAPYLAITQPMWVGERELPCFYLVFMNSLVFEILQDVRICNIRRRGRFNC